MNILINDNAEQKKYIVTIEMVGNQINIKADDDVDYSHTLQALKGATILATSKGMEFYQTSPNRLSNVFMDITSVVADGRDLVLEDDI